MAERRLSLHVSALSDAEYEFYTSCFQDLVGDDDTRPHSHDNFTDASVGVREARAWIRGRFPNVQTSDIDTILKYFSPVLAHADTIDAGQFFAALRLVVHIDEGNDLDRGLAFVQANPPVKPRSRSRSLSPSKTPVTRTVSQPGASPKRPQPPLPPAPRSQSQSRFRTPSSNNPFTAAGTAIPPLPPRKPQPPPPPHRIASHITTPLMRQSLQASKVGSALKQAEKMLEKERVMEVLKSSTSPTAITNRRSTSPTKLHPGVPSSSSSNEREKEAPPLPRRRTVHLSQYSPPLSATSWEQVAAASVSPITKRPPPPPKSSKPKPPPLPPKPSPERMASDLPPPTHPDRKPSISASSHSHSFSMDSPASEATSFEAVYGADFQVTPRVTRSKSLHASPTHPSYPHAHTTNRGGPPPVSPFSKISSRKRPESVNVPTRQLSLLSLVGAGHLNGDGEGSETSASESHIAKTLEKLTKARYKAEAGLSRRGFVPDSHDSLVHNSTGGSGEDYRQLESALNSDSSDEDLKRRRMVTNQMDGWMGPL